MNQGTSEDVDPAPGVASPAPTLTARLALWLVLAVVVVHTGVIALWVAPNNLLRQSVGASRVSDYVLPMWDQAWSVFAPEADSEYDRYQVRALVKEGPVEKATAWTAVTAREVLGSVRHHPFPSRTALLTTRLGAHVKRYYDALNQDQKQVVADAARDVSVDELRAQLLAAADSEEDRRQVTPFMRAEIGTERFLSGVADALWGEGVIAIQFRKDKMVASRYTGSGARQVETGYQFYSNWRPRQALTDAERSAYRSYVAQFGIGATGMSVGAKVRAFEDLLLTRRISVYGVAVSRILGALAYVGILITNFSQRDLLFGPASDWVRAYRDEYPQASWVGMLENASGVVFSGFYLLVILLGLAFALGWHSRLTGPLLLLGAFQILEMNPLVSDQGDNILRIGLFFILLTDNAAVWSLDAVRRQDATRTSVLAGKLRSLLTSPGAVTAKTLLHNGAVIALAAQLVIVYISAGMFKAGGDGWKFGTAISYPLRLDEYRVWPLLNDVVVSSAVAVWLMTYVAVFLQLYFPALLLHRVSRRIALAALVLLHLGIAVLMGLPWFSLAMVAFDGIFVSRATYEALGRWIEGRWRSVMPPGFRRAARAT